MDFKRVTFHTGFIISFKAYVSMPFHMCHKYFREHRSQTRLNQFGILLVDINAFCNMVTQMGIVYVYIFFATPNSLIHLTVNSIL